MTIQALPDSDDMIPITEIRKAMEDIYLSAYLQIAAESPLPTHSGLAGNQE